MGRANGDVIKCTERSDKRVTFYWTRNTYILKKKAKVPIHTIDETIEKELRGYEKRKMVTGGN